jgi:nitrogen regulatory protein PII 2
MKEVMAVIRMNMMNKTKKALAEAGITSFTATSDVLGRGKGDVDTRAINGAKEGYEEAISQLRGGPKLYSKRLFTVVVPDAGVPKIVGTIIRVNQTGKQGDGKVFVLPIDEAHRVRTGEIGDEVLDKL